MPPSVSKRARTISSKESANEEPKPAGVATTAGKKEHVRKKVWKPKTKTGCMTCRIRRVKCDEEKPHCRRCTSTGRRCDGYPALTNEVSQSHAVVYATPQPQPPVATIPGLNLDSIEEQEAFHFFKDYTANELSGFYDSSFWQFEILQASHILPSIRHAIIAMAAMHRKFITGRIPVVPDDTFDEQLNFAIHQSTLALGALTRTNDSLSDSKNLLTTSILFYCLSCFQGNHQAAIEHLRNGLRILREVFDDFDVTKEDVDHHPISMATLRTMFVTMDGQARGIMSDKEIRNWEMPPPRMFTMIPTKMKTFAQARYYLEMMFGELQTFLQELNLSPPMEPKQIQEVSERIQQFHIDFTTMSNSLDEFLLQLAPATSQEERQSVLSIRLHREQIKMYLRPFRQIEDGTFHWQKGWQVDEHDISLMLDIATELLKAPADVTLPAGAAPEDYYPLPAGVVEDLNQMILPSCARPVFSSGSGLCSALWVVTSRAASSAIRRRAIAMMLKYPRREGVWDSVLAGRVAWERLILEETALDGQLGVRRGRLEQHAAYIPIQNKIRSVEVKYLDKRVATVTFRSKKQAEMGYPGVLKLMAW